MYDELRRLAHHVRQGRPGETYRTTALVHDAYLKLAPSSGMDWEGRAHLFGVAARHAPGARGRGEQLLALDDALARLAVLGVSLRTVEREWRAARAWLAAELRDDGPG